MRLAASFIFLGGHWEDVVKNALHYKFKLNDYIFFIDLSVKKMSWHTTGASCFLVMA